MQTPRHDRRATLIIGAAMAMLAVVLAFIAWDGLVTFTQAFSEHRRVEVRTGAAAAFVAAVQIALLIGMFVSSTAASQSSLLRIALWLSPLLILGPVAVVIITNITLPKHGYTRCGPLIGQRFLAVTWAPKGTACAQNDFR